MKLTTLIKAWACLFAVIPLGNTGKLSCYSCSSFAHPGDCMYMQRCNDNEICFVEGKLSDNGNGNKTVVYDSGCRRRDQCKVIVPPSDDYNHQGKRAIESVCDMCCDENFCNWDLCDRHKLTTEGPRCLKCETTDSPKNCLSVVQCTHDEICFAQEYMTSSSRIYKLGCATEKVCLHTVMEQQIVGKRASNPHRCGQCCRGDHCNFNLCAGNHSDYKLLTDETKISSDVCEDKSYELCTYTLTTLGASCTDLNVRHLCPKSCGACVDASCVDNATFSCNEVSKVYDVCADVQKAKKYCKKFCDYCHAVDGGWGTWSSWTQCSLTCGNGTQSRSRNCTNPAPSPLGNPCHGKYVEERVCSDTPCPENGAWTEWSVWSDCTGNCSYGNSTRSRSCSNPPPVHGGSNCTGETEEMIECGIHRGCEVDGSWGAWSQWHSCHRYCYSYSGNGCNRYKYLRRRTRDCNNPIPAYGGKNCIGSGEEARSFLSSCCN